jgi:PAS domain S-box-containing protein
MARIPTGSRKKETVAALKAQVEALEKELELARDPVIRFDVGRDRRISNANETLARVTGRSLARLNGLRLDTILSPWQGKLDLVFDHYLKGAPYPGPAKPFETIEIRGTGRYFLFSFRPKRDKRGTTRSFRVTAKEVTKELLAGRVEQYHRTGEAIHRTIDRLHLGCLHAYNATGKRFTSATLISGMTNRMASDLGYKLTKVTGRPYYRGKPELYRHAVTRLLPTETVRALDRCLSDGSEDWIEAEILECSGSRRPARFSIIRDTGVWGNTVFTVLIADRSEEQETLRHLSAQLIQSEEKYRNLFEQANDAVFVEQLDGTIHDCNKRGCEFLGHRRDEILGKKIWAFIPKEFVPGVKAARERLKREGSSWAELGDRHPDGTAADIEADAVRIEIGGRPFHQVMLRDVTERKRLERELRDSEEKYRNLFEGANDGIFLEDFEGNILDCNRRACELYGYSRDEMLAANIRELLTDEAAALLAPFLKKLKREGYAVAQAQNKRRDGSIVEVEVSASVIEIGGRDLLHVTCRDITERRRAEEALQASERRYRAIVQDQAELICRFRPDGTLTFVNDAYCRFFGKKPEALVGRRFFPLIPKEDREQVRAVIAALSPDAPVGTVEHRVIAHHGELRWQHWTNRAVYDEQARLVELQAVGRDVTKRKRAEAAIRESEQKYRTTIDAMADSIHVVDRDLRIILANRRFVEWLAELGQDIDPVGKRPPEAFPFLPETVQAEYARVFESGHPIVTEETTAVGDRDVITETRKIPVLSGGDVAQVVTVVRDITERKRLEQEIRDSEEKYRTLVENLHAGLLIIQDGRIQYSNPALEAITGYSTDALQGRPFDELVSDADRESILERYRTWEAGEDQPEISGLRAKRANGREIVVEIYASRVTYRGRSATQVLARDVTEERLLQRQLQRAARLASVGTLAAGVAHEINNPLAVISVDLPRLKRQYAGDAFIARLCTKLLRMTRRISRITGGLLTFSKATSGLFGRLALHGPLNGALELMRSRFDFEHKQLVKDYPEKLPAVWCDSDQLQQVFVNLCINALEAMPEGGTLTVSAETNRRHKTIALRFADTGKGMMAEAVERAFDPFYTSKETGTGLGLAICHSIVDDHGGHISIRSTPGRGTTVSVVLPLHEPGRSRPESEPRRRKRKASS